MYAVHPIFNCVVPSVVEGDVLIFAVEVFLVIGVGQAVGGGQVGQETVGQLQVAGGSSEG